MRRGFSVGRSPGLVWPWQGSLIAFFVLLFLFARWLPRPHRGDRRISDVSVWFRQRNLLRSRHSRIITVTSLRSDSTSYSRQSAAVSVTAKNWLHCGCHFLRPSMTPTSDAQAYPEPHHRIPRFGAGCAFTSIR